MPGITRERSGQLVRAVFQVLLDRPEGLQAREILRQVEGLVPPTEFEASDYPNRPGVRRYEKIIRFATIGPVKAGWLVKDNGQWVLTDDGRIMYEQLHDPADFMREASRRYREWRRGQPDEQVEEEELESPDPSTTLEEAEESGWAAISDFLLEMPPYEFQELVASLLRAMGYHVAWVAPPGPDRGIDIVAFRDPLGASTPRIKVQVKRRSDRIPADGLRSFMAVLGEEEVGIFVATGGFTTDAEMEARTQERRRVTLVDLRRLFDLWVEHYDRLPELDKSRLPLKAVYFLTPST
jgi:restriction system protein